MAGKTEKTRVRTAARFWKILKRSFAVLAGLYLLSLALTSSFLICHCYIPLLSACSGMHFSAREFHFSPFRGEKNLQIKDLKLHIGAHAVVTVYRMYAEIDLSRILTGKGLLLDRIRLVNPEFLFTHIPRRRPDRLLPDVLTKHLHIGSVKFERLAIRYAPERSAHAWGAYIHHLSADGILPGQWNEISFQSTLSLHLSSSGVLALPLTGKIHYKAGKNYLPEIVNASFDTGAPEGNLYQQALSEVRLNGNFSVKMTGNEHGSILLKHFDLHQTSAGKNVFSMTCRGEYQLKSSAGTLSADLSAKQVPPLLAATLFKGKNPPEHLTASAHAEFTKNGPEITASAVWKASAERIVCPDRTIISAPVLSGQTKTSFRLDTGTCRLNEISLKMTEDAKMILSLRNQGAFVLIRNPDKSWKTDASNASLRIRFDQFPLGISSGILSGCWDSGRLSAEYFIRADSVLQSLTGQFSGKIQSAALRNGGKTLIREHDILFHMDFHSRGLDRIRNFIIPSCRIRQISNGKTFAEYQLNGFCSFPGKIIELSGTLQAKPLFLFRLLEPDGLRKLCERWEGLPAKEREELFFSIRIKADATKKEAVFSAGTTLNTPMLLESNHKNRKLKINAEGKFLFRTPQKKFLLEHFSAVIPEIFSLSAKAQSVFPENTNSAELNLETLKPDLIRTAALLFQPENPDDREILERLDFDNIAGHAKIRWNEPQSQIEITSAELRLRQKPGEILRLTLLSPLKGNPSAMRFQDAYAELSFENFPVSAINPFIPERTQFSFPASPMNGRVGITLKDALREVPIQADLTIEDFAFQKRGTALRYGDCQISGQGVFHNFFDSMSYKNAAAAIFANGEKNLALRSSGTMLLRPPYTEDFTLFYDSITKGHVAAILPAFSSASRLQEFQGKAKLDILCRDFFNDLTFLYDLQFDKAVFQFNGPTAGKEKLLHGKAHVKAQFLDRKDLLKIHPSELSLEDKDGNPVLHIAADGSWRRNRKKQHSVCKISSNTADWRLLRKFFGNSSGTKHPSATHSAGNPSPDNNKRPSAVQWPFTGDEPKKIDLADYSAELDFSLKNWHCGKDAVLTLNGMFLAEKNIFRAENVRGQINGAPFSLDALADLSRDDGWRLEGKLTLDNLEIQPLFQTFAPDSLKQKNLSGTISHLAVSGKTTGITLRNLDRNFSFNADGEIRNFSFLMTEPDSFTPLRMLVLPLEFIPRLIDNIPGETLRPLLQHSMGDQLDILCGQKNIILNTGKIRLESAISGRKTDINVQECILDGPYVDLRIKNATFNPFHNKLRADTITTFCGIDYPLFFRGTIDHPEVDYARSIPDFFKYNSKNLAKNLFSGLLLGIYPLEEENNALPTDSPAPVQKDQPATKTGSPSPAQGKE